VQTYTPFLFILLTGLTPTQKTPNSLDNYFFEARELEKREDYSGAEKTYLQALAAFPEELEILKRLGIVYQTELKFQDSIRIFQKILEQAPHYSEVNFYLGLSFMGLNAFDKAVSAFNQELEVNPAFRRARYYLSLALRSLNRNMEAIQQLNKLITEDPKDTKVLYELARLHKAAALRAVNQLSRLDPDSDLFHALQAETYVEGEKFPEAIREYKEVMRKNPHFPGIHFALGQVY